MAQRKNQHYQSLVKTGSMAAPSRTPEQEGVGEEIACHLSALILQSHGSHCLRLMKRARGMKSWGPASKDMEQGTINKLKIIKRQKVIGGWQVKNKEQLSLYAAPNFDPAA